MWDYAVGDKYSKLWFDMKNMEGGIPMTLEEGLEKVNTEEFALIGEMIIIISLGSRVEHSHWSRNVEAHHVRETHRNEACCYGILWLHQ